MKYDMRSSENINDIIFLLLIGNICPRQHFIVPGLFQLMLEVAGVETKLFIVPQQKLFHDSENTNLKIQSFLGVVKNIFLKIS